MKNDSVEMDTASREKYYLVDDVGVETSGLCVRFTESKMQEQLYQKMEETALSYVAHQRVPTVYILSRQYTPAIRRSYPGRHPISKHRILLFASMELSASPYSLLNIERARIWTVRACHLSNSDIDMLVTLGWRGI